MKRLAAVFAVLLVLGALAAVTYPVAGIWHPRQIAGATVDGQAIEKSRLAELYWDLQRSRFGDAPSKCLGWVELQLRNGTRKQARLGQAIALERWADCSATKESPR